MTLSLFDLIGENDDRIAEDVSGPIELTRDVERGWPIHAGDADALSKAFGALGFHAGPRPDESRPSDAGIFSAIERFQEANGINPSGSMSRGGMTILHLNKALATRNQPSPRSIAPVDQRDESPTLRQPPRPLEFSAAPRARDPARQTPFNAAARFESPPLSRDSDGSRRDVQLAPSSLVDVGDSPRRLIFERSVAFVRSSAYSSALDPTPRQLANAFVEASALGLLWNGRRPTDQHRAGVAEAERSLAARGFQVIRRETVVIVFPSLRTRRYDLLVRTPAGRYIGVEVKTTREETIYLKRLQVDADEAVVASGGYTIDGRRVTGVAYEVLCTDCDPEEITIASRALEKRLIARGIPFRRGRFAYELDSGP